MNACPCPMPRAAWLNLGRGALVLSALIAASGCGLLVPGLDGTEEPCPDIACAEGCEVVQPDEGCAICECTDPEPTVCFDDDECGDGQRCDTESYCEPPPGCTDDEPCPAVCYGRCVDEPAGCTSDEDCGEDERCRYGAVAQDESDAFREPPPDDEEPADPMPEPEPEPSPGVCVPDSCDDTLDLPACPPGTELAVDFDEDECGQARCRPIPGGGCRDLEPEQCESAPGCHLEELYEDCCGGTEPATCDCAPLVELICVEDEGCEDLDPEACAEAPQCRGQWVGDLCDPTDCPEDALCAPEPCEGSEFLCLPRTSDGCGDGGDCGLGEICVSTQVCTEVCWEAEDGTSGCEVTCWNDEGHCVPSEESCWDLPPELCEERADCVLDYESAPCECAPGTDCDCPGLAAPVCRPLPSPSCFSDEECGPGQYCDLEETCPDCSGDNDLDCAAPCYLEGTCRDGAPPPQGCTTDDECGGGYICETVTVCEDCAAEEPIDDGSGAAPPPDDCTGTCWEEGICVPGEPADLCWVDEDCGGEQICNTWDYCEAPPDCPECLIACMGRCEEPVPEPGDYCYSDDDCTSEEFCNTDVCLPDPDCPVCDVCAFQCEPREGPAPECFTDDDCVDLGEGYQCLPDPGCDPNVDFCPSSCQQAEPPPDDGEP